MIEFVKYEQMYIMHSFFKKKPQRKCIWRSESFLASEIDYIKEHLIQDCSLLNNFNAGSYHRLVRCKLLLKIKVERMKLLHNSKKSVDIINAQKRKEEFNLEVKNCFQILQSILEKEQDVTIVNKKLTNPFQEIAMKIAGEAEVKKTLIL